MDCPIDGTTLAMSSREGVEIDYCPTCRGVWLDRGELDKLIERENRWIEENQSGSPERSSKSQDRKPAAAPKAKKKKGVSSFLQDIMEMGQG